jgi:tRNA threonylcarbamoyladenosine biosynthesis protein TsaB
VKILAIDTATTSCSVAILNAGTLCAEITMRKGQTHSKHLMTAIDSTLEMANFSVNELDGFAVTIGPGSFTGLRIGISTIKGMALAVGKPVVGISTLETLAWQCADHAHLISPLLDARKSEVYAAAYRYKENRLIMQTTACVAKPEEFVRKIKESCIFVGSGARLYRREIESLLGDSAHFVPQGQNTIRASSVAFLSQNRFRDNDIDRIADLTPYYIRKSDAELNVVAGIA